MKNIHLLVSDWDLALRWMLVTIFAYFGFSLLVPIGAEFLSLEILTSISIPAFWLISVMGSVVAGLADYVALYMWFFGPAVFVLSFIFMLLRFAYLFVFNKEYAPTARTVLVQTALYPLAATGTMFFILILFF